MRQSFPPGCCRAALRWALLLPLAASALQEQLQQQHGVDNPVLVPELDKVFDVSSSAGGERAGASASDGGWHLGSFVGGLLAGAVITSGVFGLILGPSTISAQEPSELESGSAAAAATEAETSASSPAGAASKGHPRRWTMPPSRWGSRQQDDASCEPCSESLHLFWPRTGCLVGMLLVQSVSSIILSGFTDLIEKHVSLVYFMTMLVGLGGNAGGQSVVLAVRRLVLGEPVSVREQLMKGVLMSLVIMPLAMLRAYVSHASFPMILTIGLSSGLIVVVACTAGTTVPVLLWALKVDPAHAASVIQVLMDIMGIMIVCCMGVTILALVPGTGR